MLSDEGLWHEVNRMCWNRQLGMRVVPGTCNDSQEASGAVVWNEESWKNRSERLWGQSTWGQVLLAFAFTQREEVLKYFFGEEWLVMASVLKRSTEEGMGKGIWTVQKKVLLRSLHQIFCWAWNPEKLRSSQKGRDNRINYIIGCGDQCLDYPGAEFI